jgi:hypothetical protein
LSERTPLLLMVLTWRRCRNLMQNSTGKNQGGKTDALAAPNSGCRTANLLWSSEGSNPPSPPFDFSCPNVTKGDRP